jgi:hypothetical protein
MLYYLTNESAVAHVETLAARIATWEEEQTGTDWQSTDTDIRTALQHMHIPKLVEAGVITVDATAETIELRDTDGVRQFLGDSADIDGYGYPAADD